MVMSGCDDQLCSGPGSSINFQRNIEGCEHMGKLKGRSSAHEAEIGEDPRQDAICDNDADFGSDDPY
jgi:hypothetical protein